MFGGCDIEPKAGALGLGRGCRALGCFSREANGEAVLGGSASIPDLGLVQLAGHSVTVHEKALI